MTFRKSASNNFEIFWQVLSNQLKVLHSPNLAFHSFLYDVILSQKGDQNKKMSSYKKGWKAWSGVLKTKCPPSSHHPNLRKSYIHYTIHTTLYTLHYTHYTIHTTLYTLHYTIHTTLYTLHYTHYAIHTTLYTLRYTHYTIHTMLYTHSYMQLIGALTEGGSVLFRVDDDGNSSPHTTSSS